jgi:hypothetical protein
MCCPCRTQPSACDDGRRRCLDRDEHPRVVEVTFSPPPNPEYLSFPDLRKHDTDELGNFIDALVVNQCAVHVEHSQALVTTEDALSKSVTNTDAGNH